MKEPSRKEIWKMFDQISPTYDLVNRAITFGIDRRWRKRLANYLPEKNQITLLDCATGTADQILTLLEVAPQISSAVGIDLAQSMLEIGKKKVENSKFAAKVKLQVASVLEIPFPSNSFDCVTISFGVRNLADVSLGLQEMYRVLGDTGRLLVLESSLPKNALLRKGHLFYLRHLLPHIGSLFAKQKLPYVYLNETIETFPYGQAFCNLLKDAGFTNVSAHPFLGGAVTLYRGDKP